MPSRCCSQYISKSGRAISDQRTGKGQSSSQFLRRIVLKYVLTIEQLRSSPMLVRSCLKSRMRGRLQNYVNQELPDVQAGFRKGRGTRDQIANIHWNIEKAREFQRAIYLCFIDYTRAFDCVDHNKLWKALKEMGLPNPLTCLLRNLYVGQEETVRTLYGSRLRKEYNRAVCCHPICLTSTLSTCGEMPGWMSYNLESR